MNKSIKPWYRKWWGIIIAILILPYFLLWYVWAKTRWAGAPKVIATLALVVLCFTDLAFFFDIVKPTDGIRSSTAPTAKTASVKKTKSTQSQPTSKSASKPATTPAHAVTYQFTLMSGRLSATDIQNVGISWHNPSNGQDTLPSNIAAAIQQISTSSYSVTTHPSSINNDNIWSGINNYDDPDASIACTILVDGKSVVSKTAPTSGYADCSANGLDSQSGH